MTTADAGETSIPYEIHDNPPRITCGQCGSTSYNSNDVYYRYCGACNTFLGPQVRKQWNHKRDFPITEAVGYSSNLQGMIHLYGAYKKIAGPDGIWRKVPSERILTQGIKTEELSQFPEWEDE
jgi:ribosomal protein L37E